MPTQALVSKAWQPIYTDPIVLKIGDLVAVEDRPSEWAGWVWCTASDGKTGWVPAAYLNRTNNTARATRDYIATELAVQPDDELTLLDSESGWYWARNPQGQLGWVPVENLQP